MKRGEVWWADLPAPVGKRRVVLLSRDEAYRVRSHVTVAQVTTVVRNIPVEVGLNKSDGLPKECVVNLDTVMTISKKRLVGRISFLNPEKIIKLNNALRFALAL